MPIRRTLAGIPKERTMKRNLIAIAVIVALSISVAAYAVPAPQTHKHSTKAHATKTVAAGKGKAGMTCPMGVKGKMPANCPTPGKGGGVCPVSGMSSGKPTAKCPMMGKAKSAASAKTMAKKSRIVSAVCPVMGTKIPNVRKAAGKSVYNGKTYYFCCPSCKPAFDRNPAKYLRAKHN
jgi:YHS domain-containing protein